MSRRQLIAMTETEIDAYLAEQLTVIVVSNGRDGFPHPMPMHFCVEAPRTIAMTTYRKSQKVQNLLRDPRASLLIESGREYAELRSLLLRANTEIVDDHAATMACMRACRAHSNAARGTSPGAEGTAAFEASLARRAEKRLVLRFHPETTISWDHRKLDGRY
jgi:nitroimidazol reductase NimA-like FMN-containing flavoprotein (pyridoxamine 5'-phosphate oxidase superfamily)